MPEETVADPTYRERIAAGARIREGSEQILDLIAAGTEAKVHRAAFRARQLRDDVQQLAGDHPRLRLVADALAPVEQDLREYAEAV